MIKLAPIATIVVAVAMLAGSAPAAPTPLGAQLAKVRAATAKYHSVKNAVADGYVQASPCVSLPGTGAMGIHYRKNALVDGTFNPLTPEVLVYEPMRNGRLRLVAVEYFAWATDVSTAPTLFGKTFVGPETHGLAAHYELHAWLWKHNPTGMFQQWNPRVVCPS